MSMRGGKSAPPEGQGPPLDMLNGAPIVPNKQNSSAPLTPQDQTQPQHSKRRRRDNQYDRELSRQQAKNKYNPEGSASDANMSLIKVGLMDIASPSGGLTEEKFKNLVNYSNSLQLHALILVEHQLSSTETPAYVSRQR